MPARSLCVSVRSTAVAVTLLATLGAAQAAGGPCNLEDLAAIPLRPLDRSEPPATEEACARAAAAAIERTVAEIEQARRASAAALADARLK